MSGGRGARLLPAQQQCLFAIRPTQKWHTYVSRFPGEEFKLESLNLTVKYLLKIMIWCCMARSQVKSQVKNILFQQDHNIVCINQKHQHSLVKKRLHKRENPAKDGQPR